MARQTPTGAESVDDSFDDIQAITKSDTIDEAHRLQRVRAIRSQAGGTVKLITQAAYDAAMAAGALPTAANGVALTLAAGETLRVRTAFVLATDTAAADLWALF